MALAAVRSVEVEQPLADDAEPAGGLEQVGPGGAGVDVVVRLEHQSSRLVEQQRSAECALEVVALVGEVVGQPRLVGGLGDALEPDLARLLELVEAFGSSG
jgi:hypothetical protein